MGKRIDYTGQKHYRLTFVRPTDQRRNGAVVWEFICECGQTTFAPGKDVVRGNTKSCGCYSKEQRKVGGMKNRRYDPVISSAREVWARYADGCTFNLFYSLSRQPCYYCGQGPQATYKGKRGSEFTYNGLDRLDNSRGHEPDNVVPCCYRCNQAKNTMTQAEFIALVKMIYDKHLLVR